MNAETPPTGRSDTVQVMRCDRRCLECRGDFDVIDRKTGRRIADVDDATAMNRLLAEFGWEVDER